MSASIRNIIVLTIVLSGTAPCMAQFANTYIHNVSDDHTAVVKSISKAFYIQASTTLGTTKDIHLMKIDASGNVVLDKLFHSPAGNEVALDICRGNGNTYLICGYEQVGGFDLGFVLQVDTNFNFVAKANIQVPAGNRHTPALNIINSAFYEQPNPNLYFPPDTAGGYLVTGFEAVGYNAIDAKSGYALKLSNSLAFQWVAKLDSPIPGGSPDWDMCSHGTYMWAGPKSYFVGGSGTSPTGEQVALAAEIDMNGALVWTKIYHDTNAPGETTVASAGAFDDQPIPMELYQLTNHSQTQGGGFITFAQGTGAIILPKSRHIPAATPDYYFYEFGATCAANVVLISGYGHNKTAGSITGYFPFTFRYIKDLTQAVDPSFSKYAYPVESANYNPNTTIFDAYQTGGHPRIYYPKLFGQLQVNEVTLASYEDIATDQENHLVHPYFNGQDSCSYIDPGFAAIPISIFEWPANHQLATYVMTPGSYNDTPQTPTLQPCNNCTADPSFTITPGTACTYTFTANNPGPCGSTCTLLDNANTILFSGPGPSFNFTFLINGTYTICYENCNIGTNGIVCRDTYCQTIQVNCPPPCALDADFTFNVSGCCVSFQDLTPDGNPDGCEYWVFGNIQVTLAGDITSFCFPGSGTYTVCHVDCCTDAFGVVTYQQVCKQVTVNCTPPCCLPTDFNVTATNCCVTATPVLPSGCAGALYYYWTFGDGNFSTQQNPTHCYAGSGKYTICLTAYCSKTQKVKFCKTVKVLCIVPPPPPNGGSGTARFSYNLSGTSISLTPSPPSADLSITSHQWDFGDGQTSTASAPSHYYIRSGTYPITHTVEGTDQTTGSPFTAQQTVQVIMALAPACGCVPPDLAAMAGGALVCDNDNTVLLKLIDFDSESDVEYQWMRSTCSSPGCATSQFEEIPGAIGQHVWVDDVTTTSYFRCRSTSPLGFITWSEEVGVVDGESDLVVSSSPGVACPGSSVILTASGAVDLAWSTGETTNSITVSPTVATTYSVEGTNPAGCIADGETTVEVGTNDINLIFQTDGTSNVGWELREQVTNIVMQSGGGIYPASPGYGVSACLPDGDFYLVVTDDAGDGFTGGGYILQVQGGQRIIDNRNNFTTGSISQIANGGGFTLPLGSDRPIFPSCDKMDWVTNKFIVATENAAVTAQFNVTNTTSGYEFWFFDPNGSYSFRRFRSHATSDGFGAGATRACHFRVNVWTNTLSTPHIPANVLLNVRVRGRVAGSNLSFGPACRFKIDPARAACPLVSLQDNPANASDFSCGVSRVFGGANSSANKLVATPPQPIPAVASSNVRYQFRFRINGEFPQASSCIVRPPQTSPTLHLNWPASSGPILKCNVPYEVDVRVSLNGGATWCVGNPSSSPAANFQDAAIPSTAWGKVCTVYISGGTCLPSFQGGSSSMTVRSGGELTMYPNPNRGDQLFLSLSEVAADVNTATVDIFDMTGKRVMARTIAVTDNMINTNLELNPGSGPGQALAGGLYLVNITAGTKTYIERLVIQP